MARYACNSNWYLIFLIVSVVSCTTVRQQRLSTETAMIHPASFFAEDKSVTRYKRPYLEQLEKEGKISSFLFDCLVGNVKRGVKGIQKKSLDKNTHTPTPRRKPNSWYRNAVIV